MTAGVLPRHELPRFRDNHIPTPPGPFVADRRVCSSRYITHLHALAAVCFFFHTIAAPRKLTGGEQALLPLTSGTMSRFSTFLAAILLALISLAAGLPAGSMLASHTASHIVHRSIGLGRDTLREDDRMERRDCKHFLPVHLSRIPAPSLSLNSRKYKKKLTPRATVTWTNSKSPQNLCGDSSFTTSDDDADPSVSDCQTFLDWVSDREGFWLVTGFSSGGDSWEEFARVESCAIAVRHADSATGTIP